MAGRKKMDLLTAVEQIVEMAKGSGLSDEFYKKAGKPIKYMCEKLELTKEQSVMMAMFIENSTLSSINVNEFGEYLGCRTTKIIRYMSDIDVLEKREFLRCCRERNRLTYSVPYEVIDAFKRNEKYMPKDCANISCEELFSELGKIFELRDNKEVTFNMLVDKIHHLFDCNPQLTYVQKVRNYGFIERDEMLLVLFSHLFVNNNDDNIRFHDLEFLYDFNFDWHRVKSKLNNERHILQVEKIIEYNNSGGFADRDSFRMTDRAKKELFGELNMDFSKKQRRKDVVKSDAIIPKNLFYGEKITSQIAELGKLLDEGQYKQVRDRMKNTGFRCAFTCLFYGAPGTGKTETVLQLARQTGRDIMQVDMSQIKSMWVGESEKNIKQVFDDYKAMVSDSKLTPILLFNEADAIIGKRQEGAERAVDKMENSIQNIILQEMETLDGILIATTNLAQNLDKAFERRFLYKIKFDTPTVEARIQMWHEMIPDLSDEESRMLAAAYNFSGGQIENIARHFAISNILHGESEHRVETISAYCDEERIKSGEKRAIGFAS